MIWRLSINRTVSPGEGIWAGDSDSGSRLRTSALVCCTPGFYATVYLYVLRVSAQHCIRVEAMEGVVRDSPKRCLVAGGQREW